MKTKELNEVIRNIPVMAPLFEVIKPITDARKDYVGIGDAVYFDVRLQTFFTWNSSKGRNAVRMRASELKDIHATVNINTVY